VADNKTVTQPTDGQEEPTVFTTVELPESLHTQTKIAALTSRTTLRQIVIDGLRMWLAVNNKEVTHVER
jgi:hypothetical protein